MLRARADAQTLEADLAASQAAHQQIKAKAEAQARQSKQDLREAEEEIESLEKVVKCAVLMVRLSTKKLSLSVIFRTMCYCVHSCASRIVGVPLR